MLKTTLAERTEIRDTLISHVHSGPYQTAVARKLACLCVTLAPHKRDELFEALVRGCDAINEASDLAIASILSAAGISRYDLFPEHDERPATDKQLAAIGAVLGLDVSVGSDFLKTYSQAAALIKRLNRWQSRRPKGIQRTA